MQVTDFTEADAQALTCLMHAMAQADQVLNALALVGFSAGSASPSRQQREVAARWLVALGKHIQQTRSPAAASGTPAVTEATTTGMKIKQIGVIGGTSPKKRKK